MSRRTRGFGFLCGLVIAPSALAGCGQDEPGAGPAVEAAAVEREEAAPEELVARYGRIRLERGFLPDPLIRDGVAGGSVAATRFGSGCAGQTYEAPDFEVTVAEPLSSLRVMVSGNADLSLVVGLPGGSVRCSDDVDGTHPAVDFVDGELPGGSLWVYVGVREGGATAPYLLGISELRSTLPSSLEAPEPLEEGTWGDPKTVLDMMREFDGP